jgi:hypothetical protein
VHDTCQRKEIGDAIGFHFLVQWRVTGHGWSEVNLKEPWLKFVVNQDIKSKKLKTVGLFKRHEHVTGIIDDMLHRNDSFYDDIFDFAEDK